MRSKLVNGRMLAKLGRTIEVQRFLLLSRDKEHMREADSVIEDVFEALIGAMFTDKGVPAVKEFLIKLIEENLDFAKLMNFSEKDMFVRYYKETHGCDLSHVATKTPDNRFKVRVYEKQKGIQVAEGHGLSRREAMDDASRRGLRGNGIRI
jgi:ribonuclease-3